MYLFHLPPTTQQRPEPEPPPDNLLDLSDSDWFLLSNLLLQELNSKESSPLH
jgi:hypothetical protein